jgi:outer membrane receptor for ferrienterochelin and colicins
VVYVDLPSMKKVIFIYLLVLFAIKSSAQHTIQLSIKNNSDKTTLAGATVSIKQLNKTVIADSAGITIFKDILQGTYNITVSFIGFEEKEITLQVPQPNDTIIEVLLMEEEEHEEEEEEVVVRATRISRTIANIPTRVEVISGEELVEKGNMKPGDIRMLLNESTGIQTQQTSATSYNAGIRIQGLDGRYTQILRDGYPLYAGFSGGLSILQIAPLDLKQVEVIKGAASTLYTVVVLLRDW